MNIPVYVIAFNNLTYVKSMVDQLRELRVKKIIIVDNCSTYPPLLQYYEQQKAIKNSETVFQLIKMDSNYGSNVITNCFYKFLPEVFVITDPDLKLNPKLPSNFLEQLYNISNIYKAYKVGFALDLSDSIKFNQEMKFRNMSIEKWESQFWRDKISDEKYELYKAEIDTTFAVYNKKYSTPRSLQIRVAGDFTCKHLPWYQDDFMPKDELDYYVKNNLSSCWTPQIARNISSRYLIISPQAGFGNRIRALCAGILLAKQINRIPVHAWIPDSIESQYTHLNDIKKRTLGDYFVQNNKLPMISENTKIDLVLSEWAPGDYWYQFQNSAQKRWPGNKFIKVQENLNFLSNPKYMNLDNIMLETTLIVKLNPKLGDSENQKKFQEDLSRVYMEYFEVPNKYSKVIEALSDIDLGISIRRGDHWKYFPEANQDPEVIMQWIIKLVQHHKAKKIAIFSEDHKFRDQFKSDLSEKINIEYIEIPSGFESWETGYLEFLALSSKCQRIYGTPMSSFAEEAGLFRGKFHYQKILSEIHKVEKILEVQKVAKMELKKMLNLGLPKITIAILCKDKAHLLRYYLKSIYNLHYPKNLINLYIRTNDNKDKSAEILKKWISEIQYEYNEIYFDDSSVKESLKQYQPHDWNPERFSILGKIRQDSIKYAIEKQTDYFVMDCDNFVKSGTLMALVKSDKNAIAPFLRLIPNPNGGIPLYSNYHYTTTPDGYYKDSPEYDAVFNQMNPGIHKVDVIHCTYYLRNCILDKVNYFDKTKHHEYVIFSRNLRKAGVEQFLDNREVYGYLTFEDTEDEFSKKFTFDLCKDLFF